MKIGIDCRLWGETGVGRYIRNLVLNLQEIDKKNEYVLFVLSKDYPNINSQLSTLNSQLVRADIRWHSLKEQLEFPRILNKENLDLVHFPYFSVPIFYNRPFVVTIHDLIQNHYASGRASTLPFFFYYIKRVGYKKVLGNAVKKAKKIITVSQATKDEIIDHLGVDKDKVVVTYEGVDDKIKSFNKNGKRKIINGKYFLYVGNAYPHKNLDRLLDAFKMLTSDVKLVLIGKEDYFYAKLKDKVREMTPLNKVIFLQNVTDDELPNLYKNALALILPSLMEGFGLTALEAMANKCLVLASDIPSLKETCGNAALYFGPLDIDELADKLNMVTSHTTEYGGLEELRRKGFERVKKFSWQKMAKETLGVYNSLTL